MSGFDPAWLDLREPADHAGRAGDLLARTAELFDGSGPICVADLGSGSGSTLRALAPRLGRTQRWTLIDHDAALLAHATVRLAGWADLAENGEALTLVKGDARIATATHAADLHADPLPPPAAAADLVTASALFDLVGADWLARFVARLAAARRPLYAALSYDGTTSFSKPHPLDAAVVAAFNRHQTRDKGLGAALGPQATAALAERLRRAGFLVRTAPSPWTLGPDQAALTGALVEGMAGAAGELDDPPAGLDGWRAFRIGSADASTCIVGHLDLLALPPEAAAAGN